MNLIKSLFPDRPRGYKTFFMLNSVEYEIVNVHKYENIKKFGIFSGSGKLRNLFFLLINVNCWHFNIYEFVKFHAQLS